VPPQLTESVGKVLNLLRRNRGADVDKFAAEEIAGDQDDF